MKCLGKRWSILLLILLLAAFCWGCQENSILIGTQKLPLDAAMVDLSGAPLPEQEELVRQIRQEDKGLYNLAHYLRNHGNFPVYTKAPLNHIFFFKHSKLIGRHHWVPYL